jgi:hypothetical protein
MQTAVVSALAAKVSRREATSLFNLPKIPLQDQDRVSKIRRGREVHIPPKLGTFERIFTVEYEELTNHINIFDARLMSLSCQEILKLEFNL